ncbi:hypothetical protein ACWDRB_31030 [Nonomuraea sp. NPDC003707]
MSLPDFLIAGVPKAGTTALHSALQQHPELYLSTVKEPKFFLTDGPPPGGPCPGSSGPRLIPYFADDIRLLQRVTGEDFSDWLRPRERSGGLVGARPPGRRQSRNGRRS